MKCFRVSRGYFQSKQYRCGAFFFPREKFIVFLDDKRLSHIDKKAFPAVMCSQEALFFLCLKCISFCVCKMQYSVGTVPSG